MTAATPTPKPTAADIRAALDRRYEGEAWVRIHEARAGLSWDGNAGQCDLITIGAWQSTGVDPVGHEVKVSRTDWLVELKHPEKAQRFMRYCARWWLVVPAPHRDIVKPGELPDTWGLMEVNAKGCRVVTQAPKLEREPLPWRWMVAWMAQAQRAVSRADAQTLAREFQRGVTEGERRRSMGLGDIDKQRLERLTEFADRVSKATNGLVRAGTLTDREAERLAWAHKVLDVIARDGTVFGHQIRSLEAISSATAEQAKMLREAADFATAAVDKEDAP